MKTPAIAFAGLLLLTLVVGCAPQPTTAGAPPSPTAEDYKARQQGGGGGSGY